MPKLDPKILRKLNLYRSNPDIIQPLSHAELADLVVLVLEQSNVIQKAIEGGQISATKELTTAVNKALKEYRAEAGSLSREIKQSAEKNSQQITSETQSVKSELDKAVERLNNRVSELQDGKDGVVSEDEVARAAQMAAALVELPDFAEMMSTAVNSDGESVRNALELLQGDDRYKVQVADVEGLQEALNKLSQIRQQNGGTIGKGQVYGFINDAIADGIIASSIDAIDDIGDVDATSPSDAQVLTWVAANSKWEAVDAPGASGGEANTGSNVGTDGVGVFKQKSLVDLEFKNIAPASTKVTVTANGDDIDLDVVPGNINTSDLNNDANFADDQTLQEAFDQGQSITIADTDNQTLTVTQNDTTNNPNAQTVTNAGTGKGLFIDQNGNGRAVEIDSEATTEPSILVNSVSTTSDVVRVDSTGIHTGTGSSSVFQIDQENASSTGDVLNIDNDGSGRALTLDQNGNSRAINIDTEATTEPAINIDIVDGDAHLRLTGDSGNATPTEGDLWRESDGLKYYDGSNEVDLLNTATTTNVTAAGALMDSELTSIADVKALDQSVVSGATPTFTTTNFTDATNKRLMTDAQEANLDAQSGTNTGDQLLSEHKVIEDLPNLEILTTFQTGHGWNSNAGGSQDYNYTTDYYLGSQSFQATTDGAGAYKYCQNVGNTLGYDLTSKNFGILLKIDDVSLLDELQVFAGDGSLTNYFKWSALEGSQATKWFLDDDWILLTFSWGDAVETGTADRGAIDDIRIAFKDPSTSAVTILFNSVVTFDQEEAVVSFSFDDGYESQYTRAYPALSKHMFPYTMYMIPSYIGDSGRLTASQLSLMQNYGCEIGGHDTGNDERVYTEAQIVARIEAQIKTYGENNLKVDGCAYPGGEFGLLTDASGTTVEEIYSRYYSYCRTINQANNELPTPSKKSRLRVMYITNAVSTATIATAVTTAIANGEWLHLVFHDIVASGASITTEYNEADLITIVDNIASEGVVVKTVRDVALNLRGTNTGDESTATDSAEGVVELATDAEMTTGTATNRAVTPANIASLDYDSVEQTSIASDTTPNPTGGSVRNEYYLTALAGNATFAAPSGTPANGNSLIVRILDNSTSRTLDWNAIYRGMADTLPDATTIDKTMYVGFRYNSADSKWDMVALNEEA